jgi:addiction module RelB/DinJ family antitoxin
MATVNYSLRMDEHDKQAAEKVFKSLGMNLSTGINIYIKAVGRQQRIPFDLALETPVISTSNARQAVSDKAHAYVALNGILTGHDIDLATERSERILAK